MSGSLFDASLGEFKGDLAHVRAVVQLLTLLRELGASDEPTGGDWPVAIQTREYVRGHSAAIPIVAGTVLLYVVGRFEHFAKVLLRTTCDLIASKCQSFDDLPEEMTSALRSMTADVMSHRRRYGYDQVQADVFVMTLATNLQATGGLGSINSECLSLTDTNLNPGTLAALFKRAGINNLWSQIGKQAPMKTALEVEKDADADRAAQVRLEDLMNRRNQIAHPNGAPTFPDTNRLTQDIDFVEVVAETLTSLCKARTTTFKPGK